MPGYQPIKCAQCGMAFPNEDALSKHKTRFCVGVKDSGIGRTNYYSDDDYPNRYRGNNHPGYRPASRKGVKHQASIDRKRHEVEDWKHKRSMLQNLKDMEDQAFYNSQRGRKPTHRSNNGEDYYLSEFERLEAQERDILRQMDLLEDPRSHGPNGLSNTERHQLDALKRENARLEQERRLIQIKLKKLILNNDQLTTMPDYEPHKLLRDIQSQRDQSLQNMHALTDPLGRRAFSTEIPTLPYLPQQRRPSGDNLRSVRNKYMQAGGHNSNVLVRYTDMEQRLTRYNHYPSMDDRPEPLRRETYHVVPPFPGVDMTSNKLNVMKDENQRLQAELNDIRRRYQALDARARRTDTGPVTYREDPNYLIPRINGHPSMNSLALTTARQDDQPRRTHRSYSPMQDRLRSPTNPYPYDPVDGFVIFFDFISNLSQGIDRVRLITCLFHDQTGLGEPSQLDACRCELDMDELSNDTMRTAYVATKQPVPRCPAQHALKILVEVQTTLKQAPNESFRTAAWAKLPVFDFANRLVSGRWKTSLKSTPIQHDERLSVIGSLPNFGHAELYYRLVNQRDAIHHSNSTFIPKSRDLYRTAPQ